MHELSLCRSIAAIADRHRDGRGLRTVGVRLGAFRQAVPDTLTYCWGIVTQGTELEGSELDFEIVPMVVGCRRCGAETTLDRPWLRCGECGENDVAILRGEEFLVTHLDLEDG